VADLPLPELIGLTGHEVQMRAALAPVWQLRGPHPDPWLAAISTTAVGEDELCTLCSQTPLGALLTLAGPLHLIPGMQVALVPTFGTSAAGARLPEILRGGALELAQQQFAGLCRVLSQLGPASVLLPAWEARIIGLALEWCCQIGAHLAPAWQREVLLRGAQQVLDLRGEGAERRLGLRGHDHGLTSRAGHLALGHANVRVQGGGWQAAWSALLAVDGRATLDLLWGPPGCTTPCRLEVERTGELLIVVVDQGGWSERHHEDATVLEELLALGEQPDATQELLELAQIGMDPYDLYDQRAPSACAPFVAEALSMLGHELSVP